MVPILQCLILGLGIYTLVSTSRSDLLPFARQKDEAANSPGPHLGSQDPAETPAYLFHHHYPLLTFLLLELADKTFSECLCSFQCRSSRGFIGISISDLFYRSPLLLADFVNIFDPINTFSRNVLLTLSLLWVPQVIVVNPIHPLLNVLILTEKRKVYIYLVSISQSPPYKLVS